MNAPTKLLLSAAALVLLSSFSAALSAQEVQALAQNYSGTYNIQLPSTVANIIGQDATLKGVVDGQTVAYAVVSGGSLTQITTTPLDATIQVSLSSDTLQAIISSADPQNAAIRAFGGGQISIDGLGPGGYLQLLGARIAIWFGMLFGQFR